MNERDKRCNLERTENGVRICWGEHDRAASCEWEYFVRPPEGGATDALTLAANAVVVAWKLGKFGRVFDDGTSVLERLALTLRASVGAAAAPGEPGMSAEALAYDLMTLPDLRIDNIPLVVAADLLSRLPIASRQATAQEVEAYASLRAGAVAPKGRNDH